MVSPFVLSPQISVSVQAHPRSPLNEYGHTRCLFRSPTYQFLPLVRRTGAGGRTRILLRSEEHTSELQSLMRISYAVFCLKKKITLHNLNISTEYEKPMTYSMYTKKIRYTHLTKTNILTQ